MTRLHQQRIVQVHVPQFAAVDDVDVVIHIARAVHMPNVQRQPPTLALHQQIERFFLLRKKSIRVLDAECDVFVRALFADAAHFVDVLQIFLPPLGIEIRPFIGQRKVHAVVQVQVHNGHLRLLRQFQRASQGFLIGIAHQRIKIAPVQPFVQVEREIHTVFLPQRAQLFPIHVRRVGIFGQIHVQLHELQPQLRAQRSAFFRPGRFQQRRHPQIHSAHLFRHFNSSFM